MNKVYSGKILQLFQEKGVREKCECCRQTDWTLFTNVTTLAIQTDDSQGISTFPIIAVECQNCGNVRFFGRNRLGVKDTAE